MLPVFTQTCTEASAAERSGLRMSVRPLGRTVRSTGSRQKASRRRRSAVAEDGGLGMKEGGMESAGHSLKPAETKCYAAPNASVEGEAPGGRARLAGWKGFTNAVSKS